MLQLWSSAEGVAGAVDENRDRFDLFPEKAAKLAG